MPDESRSSEEALGPVEFDRDRSNAQSPGLAGTLLFDGHCRVCTTSMERLRQWDRRQQFAYLSLHDPDARRLAPELTHDDLMREIYLVDPQGRRHRGAAALRIVASRIPRLWALVPFLYVPGSLPLWNGLYRVVAKWRYWLGGTEDCPEGACGLHGRRKTQG